MIYLGISTDKGVAGGLRDTDLHRVEGVHVGVLPAHEGSSPQVTIAPDSHGPVGTEHLLSKS